MTRLTMKLTELFGMNADRKRHALLIILVFASLC